MRKRSYMLVGLMVLAVLLTACQPATTTAEAMPTATAALPELPEGYPAEGAAPAVEAVDMSGFYPVQPGDENKVAGNFFPELVELRANTSDPAKTDVFMTGSLPTPCNEIRALVNPPNESRQIFVQVYSVADQDKVCTQVLQPYEGVVATITGFPAGTYEVYANSQFIGEVTIP